MPTFRETALSIYGACRLARLDAGGMAFFNVSVAGFWRSFFAAVIIAPAYAALVMLRIPVVAASVDPIQYVAVESIAYVVSWLAFPVIMDSLAQMLGCRHRYIAYIVAYNWSMVLQSGLMLPIGMLTAVGVLPDDFVKLLSLIGITLILIYIWFIARTALGIAGLAAAGVVVVDILVSLIINAVSGSLYQAG